MSYSMHREGYTLQNNRRKRRWGEFPSAYNAGRRGQPLNFDTTRSGDWKIHIVFVPWTTGFPWNRFVVCWQWIEFGVWCQWQPRLGYLPFQVFIDSIYTARTMYEHHLREIGCFGPLSQTCCKLPLIPSMDGRPLLHKCTAISLIYYIVSWGGGCGDRNLQDQHRYHQFPSIQMHRFPLFELHMAHPSIQQDSVWVYEPRYPLSTGQCFQSPVWAVVRHYMYSKTHHKQDITIKWRIAVSTWYKVAGHDVKNEAKRVTNGGVAISFSITEHNSYWFEYGGKSVFWASIKLSFAQNGDWLYI